MTAVRDTSPENRATRVAWTAVAEGYERALKTPDLDVEERALLVRQLGRSRRIAGERPVRSVGEEEQATAAPVAPDITGELWDARAERDLGVMIRRYLAEHPPPAGSCCAGVLEDCAEDLIISGDAGLGALQARPLT